MRITRQQLKRLIEAYIVSDKGEIEVPPKESTPRMPSGTAIKRNLLDPSSISLIDMDDPDYQQQGYELSDVLEDWPEGTTKSELKYEKGAKLRSAMGDIASSLSEDAIEHLSSLVDRDVTYVNGYFRAEGGGIYPGNFERYAPEDDVLDMVEQIAFNDPNAYYSEGWGPKRIKAWDTLLRIIFQIINSMTIERWSLESIVGNKAFDVIRGGVKIKDPNLARMIRSGKLKFRRPETRIEYEL